jgi:hypothetical protein
MTSPSIENLSIEDINALLPQLQRALEVAERPPIDELVSKKFEDEWEIIELSLNQAHEVDLERTKENLFLFTSLETVLTSSIGEENTKLFLKIANKCVQEKSFRNTFSFYNKVTDSTIRTIARLSFCVLQLKLGTHKSYDIKSKVNECLLNCPESVQKTFDTYQQLGLISL